MKIQKITTISNVLNAGIFIPKDDHNVIIKHIVNW